MNTRDELKKEQKEFTFWVGVAAAGHVALIVAVVFLQVFYVRMHPPVRIVSVSLVSLPGTPGPAGGPKSMPAPAPAEVKAPPEPKPAAVKKVPAPPPPPKPQPKKVPEPVVAKKVPVPVPPPKKVEPVVADKQRQQNLDNALERLKHKTETQKPAAKSPAGDVSDLSSSMANLQKKVTAQGGGGPASMGSGRGGGGGAYGTGGGPVDAYKATIYEILSKNWTPPPKPMLSKVKGMDVRVRIRIMPDGTIGERVFLKSAPSEVMNNSVAQTLKKSEPFPSPPKSSGLRGVIYDINFTPEEGVVNK
ncbi:MAG TPA: energy transducer TonB [Chlorobaculum sp.]|nr:energy transducer TonB [Chlorobaculum sp.]